MPKPRQKKSKKTREKKYVSTLKLVLNWLGLVPPKNIWVRRILLGIFIFICVCVGGMYGVARWYMAKHADEPLSYGATFIPQYAERFELEPKEVLDAILNDLGVKRIRLVSYWDEHEKVPGEYDFKELDWQFEMAEKSGARVSLAIGLRQPRWPECHIPQWAMPLSKDEWSKHLNKYIEQVIGRYKSHPALESYQLENEFFLSVFGICPDFSRERLIAEFDLAKSLDPNHPIIVTRSNNAIGLPVGQPRPDEFGVSVYKRVWDKTLTKRYYEYPFPAWFYAGLAGGGEITTGRNLFVHELQTEAWLPEDPQYKMDDVASIPEQNKSLDAARLADRMEYGRATGMKKIYLWGVEWWYWRKSVGDPSLWETAKEKVQEANSGQR